MIFITGATGFIGRYVVEELLRRGHKVLALCRNKKEEIWDEKVQVIEGSLSDCKRWENQLKNVSITACIHLAWEGIPDYSFEMARKNLNYGLEILELCKKYKIGHLIVSGSCWEYESPTGCIGEQWPLSYENSFKIAKNTFHMFCDNFCKENQIHCNWLRFFYVYGIGQRKGALIPYMIDEFLADRLPKLNGAWNENDFIYVTDAADAIVEVLEKRPNQGVLNIGSGKPTRVLDIAKMMGEKSGCKIEEMEHLKSEKRQIFYADIKKIQELKIWTPKIEIQAGIKKMILNQK